MIKDIISNEEIKIFFRNELKVDKKSGTYLFYGSDTEQLMEFALYFAKGLCCETLKGDFCDTCNVCRKIEKLIYSDLEVLDDPNGIKVDAIRELAYKSSASSYEGGKKIFILKDIQKMKKEAGNSLLKLIEEPNEGSFFILISSSLNILPTIKSRSILVKIKKRNSQELDVDDFTYSFYMGNSEDIRKFKNTTIDLKKSEFYGNIGSFLKKYSETGEFEYKTDIYKCIRDFIKGKYYISPQEKIFFVEEIMKGTSDKDIYKKIIEYTIYTLGDMKNLEERLTLKMMLRYPINIKLILLQLFLKI